MSVKVLLADDHPIVRQGLRRLLEADPEFQIVGETGDGLETVQLTEQYRPDVLIVDLMMPGLNGLEVTRQVCQRLPGVRVIVLSMHRDDAYVIQALRNGAAGYVIKDSGPGELAVAIHKVTHGQRYLSPTLTEKLIDVLISGGEEACQGDAYDLLTDREREVLQLVAEGHTATEVARKLSISPRTVEVHRANLMHKLGLTNQKELIRYAIRRGILSLEE